MDTQFDSPQGWASRYSPVSFPVSSPRRCGLFLCADAGVLKGGTSLARPEKEAAVQELKSNIESSSITVMSQYQGITVAEVTELRAKLRAENVTFKVFKNNLAKLALAELDLSDVSAFMNGPTVWAFCDDPVTPARILKEFSKGVEVLSMQGGILDGKPIDAATLDSLADLPSREQLLAQIAGTIAMPLRNLVGVLSAVPRSMVNVVDAIRRKQEEASA